MFYIHVYMSSFSQTKAKMFANVQIESMGAGYDKMRGNPSKH